MVSSQHPPALFSLAFPPIASRVWLRPTTTALIWCLCHSHLREEVESIVNLDSTPGNPVCPSTENVIIGGAGQQDTESLQPVDSDRHADGAHGSEGPTDPIPALVSTTGTDCCTAVIRQQATCRSRGMQRPYISCTTMLCISYTIEESQRRKWRCWSRPVESFPKMNVSFRVRILFIVA